MINSTILTQGAQAINGVRITCRLALLRKTYFCVLTIAFQYGGEHLFDIQSHVSFMFALLILINNDHRLVCSDHLT